MHWLILLIKENQLKFSYETMDNARAHVVNKRRTIFDMVFKLVFAGDFYCGKTSIIYRYLNKKGEIPLVEGDMGTVGKAIDWLLYF